MGKRGPPPKPTAQKKLQGTYRPDFAARNEMKPPVGTPDRPDWLDAMGRKEWDRIVPQLAALGVLADIDQGELADYCAAHSLAVRATKKYQREGLEVRVNGQRFKHPMIKVAQEARAQARLLAAEFGLSPSSRSRISAPDKDEGLAAANERIKASTSGATAEAEKSEAFLFGAPRLVKP